MEFSVVKRGGGGECDKQAEFFVRKGEGSKIELKSN